VCNALDLLLSDLDGREQTGSRSGHGRVGGLGGFAKGCGRWVGAGGSWSASSFGRSPPFRAQQGHARPRVYEVISSARPLKKVEIVILRSYRDVM
jgi:hypothetical protein